MSRFLIVAVICGISFYGGVQYERRFHPCCWVGSPLTGGPNEFDFNVFTPAKSCNATAAGENAVAACGDGNVITVNGVTR